MENSKNNSNTKEKTNIKPAAVFLSGEGLTIDEVTRVACFRAKASLTEDPQILNRVRASHDYIQNAVKIGEPIYGVTSGFGGMADVVITPEEAEELQNNLPWFHKAGAGRLLPIPDVRASMLLRANSLMRGVSGVRLELIQRLLIFLNAGVTPHVYELGSIGASGDLTPLAYITAAIVGLDTSCKVDWNGEELDAITALERLGLPRLRLLPKESLAIMNGTSAMSGIASLCVDRSWTLLALAMGAHALFAQALRATTQSFHPFIHRHKPFPGQVWSAAHMLDLLSGSRLVRDEMSGRHNYREKDLIQDRYSLRCLPQYMGPIVDGLRQISRQVEIEINSATDNPLIDVEEQGSYHCGNFLGQYIGIGMDQLRQYLGLLAKHLDVQIALLVSPEFNNGLPASLVGNPARTVNMGLKALQITGNSIMPLLTFFGNSLADRFPTHAEQFNQNINSQGFGSANLARQSVETAQQYAAVTLMFAVQAVDLRTHKISGFYDARSHLSPATRRLYEAVRETVGKPPSKEKPYIWNDNEQRLDEHIQLLVADIQSNGPVVRAMQNTLESLKNYDSEGSSPFAKRTEQTHGERTSPAPIDWGGYSKMNIAQSLELADQQFPDRVALIFEGDSFTYRDLNRLVNRIANGLADLGVRGGDRVALFLPNIPAFVFAYYGIQKIGAIAVSVNSFLKTDEVTFILNDSGASVLISTNELRANVNEGDLPQLKQILIAEGESNSHRSLDELINDASPNAEAITMEQNDPAAIVYTSGTVGFPKGATLSHGNVISNMLAKKRHLEIRPNDRLLLFLPLFHCFGQNAVLNGGLAAGATIVLHRKFQPEEISRSITENRVTMFFGVPTTFAVMYDRLATEDMLGVRYYFSAAAPLTDEIAGNWRAKFDAFVHQGYGLTETSPFASYNHRKPGSIGKPIEYVEMKVVDVENGRNVEPGKVGEIAIRGPNVMLGYWNRPTETAAVLKDGWFFTGDLGKTDYEGYFYLVDRLHDRINVGGLKVYPAEVEKILAEHPAVADVAVYGIPDELLGEKIKASVALKAEQTVTAAELMVFCLKKMANFKAPGDIEFIDVIPRSPAGKILRRVLREKQDPPAEEPAVSPPPAEQTAAAIQNWIVEWMAKHLEMEAETIAPRETFASYGMNSVMNVKLTQEIGKWLGRTLEVVLAWRYPAIESFARFLGAQSRQPDPESAAAESSMDTRTLSDTQLASLLADELKAAKQRKSK